MSKILILGSNGLLGQALQRRFVNKNFNVFASSIEPQNFLPELGTAYISADLTNRIQVRELLLGVQPDIIVNTAAYTNVDLCEESREKCWAVNVSAVENLLEVILPKKPLFVHVSTDYVFDGEFGGYREIDKPNPHGNYARSKMASESIVTSSDVEYIIVRTQILYGLGKNIRLNFVTWLINSLRENKQIRVVSDQVGSPTYAPDVAEAIYGLIDKEAYGIFHVSSPDSLSRYDFALKIAEIFELNPELIERISTDELNQKAFRPMNSSFKVDKLFNNIGWHPHKVKDALAILKKEMEKLDG